MNYEIIIYNGTTGATETRLNVYGREDADRVAHRKITQNGERVPWLFAIIREYDSKKEVDHF